MEHPELWRQVKIRLPETYRDEMRKYCKTNDISGSELARRAIFEHMHGGESIAQQLVELRRELSRIGNNLNQLTRHAHETGEISGLTDLAGMHDNMRDELRRVLRKVWR